MKYKKLVFVQLRYSSVFQSIQSQQDNLSLDILHFESIGSREPAVQTEENPKLSHNTGWIGKSPATFPKLTILKLFQSIKSICGVAKTSGWPPDTNLCQVAPPAPADSRHLPVFLALTYTDFSCLSYLWNAKLLNIG